MTAILSQNLNNNKSQLNHGRTSLLEVWREGKRSIIKNSNVDEIKSIQAK